MKRAEGAAKRAEGAAKRAGAAAKRATGSGGKSGGKGKRAAAAATRTATRVLPHRDAERSEHSPGELGRKSLRAVRRGERAAVEGVGRDMRRAARGVAKRALGHTASAAARTAARAARRAGAAGADALAEHTRKLPIQRSVDVAVPVEVAWAQWLAFDHFPEGANRATDIKRDGDTLHGRLEGPAQAEWEAEILDERENESFAWRSTKGSDSAGLLTFHRLSDRLTRLELSLDVKPVHLLEAATLALHLADRRAEAELRRFKTDAELIDPDSYEELLSENGADHDEDGEEGREEDDS